MRQLKNWDNKTWLSSKKYIQSFHKFIKKITKINKKIYILDIGCGRGNIISFLQNYYNFIKKPIGIDVLKNDNIKKNIIFKKTDALKFLKNKEEVFDLILIKQTIHYFSENQIPELLHLAKKSLKKNGKILILSLKTKNNQIPCFRTMRLNLQKSLKRDEMIIRKVKQNLKNYKNSFFSFEVKISKIKYIEMIKKRYISILLNISKKELYNGIKEIKSRYKNQIIFTDILNCIKFTK